MKKLFLTLSIAVVCYTSFAQNTFPTPTGNVGIGTTSPVQRLHISDGNAVSSALYTSDWEIISGQNLAVGTNIIVTGTGANRGVYKGTRADGTLSAPTIVQNNEYTVSVLGAAYDGSTAYPTAAMTFLIDGTTAAGVVPQSIMFETGTTNSRTERMRITAFGNVLIGKTSQTNTTYKLDIAGSARANSIVVNTTGADFVFKPTYKLAPLATVEQYIAQNHHLPEIASAKEMQTNGLDLGQNQIKLLQKVEELTLYMIEKDKQLNDEKAAITTLQHQNDLKDVSNKQLSDQVKSQQNQISLQQEQLKSQQQQIDLLIEQVAKISTEKNK